MAKVFCPKCSSIANPLHRASTVGTATGITAGGATVIVGMVRGARAGSALGVVGTTIGAAAGAIFTLKMYPKGAILYHQDFHFPVQRLY